MADLQTGCCAERARVLRLVAVGGPPTRRSIAMPAPKAGTSRKPMPTAITALAPVFLLIAFGALLRHRDRPGETFWFGAEWLVYWVLFPSLLLVTTWGAELAGFRVVPVAAAIVLGMAVVALASLPLRRILRLSDSAFASVFQSSVRTNTYIGLAAAQALWGQAGLTLSGLVIAIMIPSANVWAVWVHARYGTRRLSGRKMVQAVVSNPLIVACLVGFTLNAGGVALPEILAGTLRILGQASLTLGLLCVGAGLEPRMLGRLREPVAVASFVRLVLAPAATAGFGWLFGVEGLTLRVAVLFAALPVSASSYILARQMGGDAPLIAAIITASTVAGAITLPLMIALMA